MNFTNQDKQNYARLLPLLKFCGAVSHDKKNLKWAATRAGKVRSQLCITLIDLYERKTQRWTCISQTVRLEYSYRGSRFGSMLVKRALKQNKQFQRMLRLGWGLLMILSTFSNTNVHLIFWLGVVAIGWQFENLLDVVGHHDLRPILPGCQGLLWWGDLLKQEKL